MKTVPILPNGLRYSRHAGQRLPAAHSDYRILLVTSAHAAKDTVTAYPVKHWPGFASRMYGRPGNPPDPCDAPRRTPDVIYIAGPDADRGANDAKTLYRWFAGNLGNPVHAVVFTQR
jgi:hypothetical protein